ncbi:unnamed protein product [Mytilus coruscus]|uniref:Peptidase aspartic putative domain-containing protein n=1 Tax=Mytilus coruscus TaxID=42192 RepID=A0A6J8A9E9_MYTCO|nr:unnamed protein product [Mytilus coruscus]
MAKLKKYVKDIYLADDLPFENESSEIDNLIGNDYYLDLILAHRLEVQPGLYLLASKLGWMVTGRVKDTDDQANETGLLIMSHTNGNELQEQKSISKKDYGVLSSPDLSDFWKLESIGITYQTDNTDNEIEMKIFKDTLTFEKGRYQVKWPWKEDSPDLPMNRNLALGRLKSNVDRKKKKQGLLKQYDSIIQDQLSKEIIEEVDIHNTEGLVHYIPHHAVISPLKTTTKVRIVYDTSAKTKKEVKSLNECLYRGPVLLQNLCGC